MKRLTQLLAIAALILTSACATGPFLTWEPETDAEREMRESAARLQRTVSEATVLGTLGGGLLGALGGGVRGAIQGAEIGRFGGAGAGNYVASLQEKYATREAVLAQVLSDIKTTNAEITASIAHMKRLLAERRGVLASARAGQTVTSLAQETARGERNLGEMNKAVAAAEDQVEFFSATRSLLAQSGSARGIDPQIALMRDRIKAMQSIANTLATEL